MTPFEKFTATRTELSASLIEREQEIDLILTALIAKEHVLLVGPPGTGKSMLADAVVSWLDGSRFSMLLTKYSTPEEVFGPISVAGLKADVYRRVITGKLPEADVAFIDEIFKGSSAILNTMLRVLNERTFQNDGTLVACPLKLCIGASNEWPGDQEGGKELGALFDRFLLRKLVRPIATEKSIHRLLWDVDLTPGIGTRLSETELDEAHDEARLLPWTAEAKEAFLTIHRQARSEGIVPGDRRLRKSVTATQAFTWLNGGAAVEPDHLEILAHILWDDPAEQPKKMAEIVGAVANPQGMKINSLLMEADQVIAATNMKDLASAIAATKKLKEVHKQLAGMTGAKAQQAREHVESEGKRIKAATMESMS
jgi:MoxR-like ATPase